MGMSTHVVAMRNMGHEFEKMLKVKHFCEENKVGYPYEVADYFGEFVKEDESVIRDAMAEVTLSGDNGLTEFTDEYRTGYEVEIAKLPKEVKVIRFYNSW